KRVLLASSLNLKNWATSNRKKRLKRRRRSLPTAWQPWAICKSSIHGGAEHVTPAACGGASINAMHRSFLAAPLLKRESATHHATWIDRSSWRGAGVE